jgi:high-affinity iron transporter
MLAALIIVLREVFEASLIIGVALAASRGLAGSRRAVATGVAAGLAGAIGLAAATGPLSAALAGIGPEVFNAGILMLAVAMLAWHHVWMQGHGSQMARDVRALGVDVSAGTRPLMALAVVIALAVLREGAEVVLFLHGIAAGGAGASSMFAGGALGILGGAAMGTLLYLGLLRIPPSRLFAVTGVLLLCLAAGMAAQAAAYLVQAGLVPALVEPLWDSSAWLPQHGLPGQVLHALLGYDDRPSGMQAVFFAATLIAILGGTRLFARGPRRPPARRIVPAALATAAIAAAGALLLLAAPRAEAAYKVYSPIVEEGETAIEAAGHRAIDDDSTVDGSQEYKLELEHSPAWFWLTAVGAEWEKAPGGDLEATEASWENVFQLFEQGRYPVDVGLLVEYAHSLEHGGHDKLEIGALLQKEFGPSQVLVNLIAERDLTSGADTELEYALQYRWRGDPRFEPGIEVYGEFGDVGDFGSLGDHGHEAGPALFGKFRLGSGAIKYEAAWLFGLTADAADQTLRFLVEYEF